MADDPNVDTSDNVRHADEAARKAAQERMQEAIKAKESGQEIEVDTAGLESTVEDTQVSGSSETEKADKKDKKKKKAGRLIEKVKVYSPLVACDVVIRSDRGEETIKIERGVMHVFGNTVTIFLDV